ncbi:MAG: enoyl-CoA hydratase-related protein [Steroidobacteraceae bacterium]
MSDLVLYEERGAIAVITLNRPQSLNAVTGELANAIERAFERAAAGAAVRAVVFAAAGRGFSAGAELKGDIPSVDDAIQQLEKKFNPAIRAITLLPKPVVAAVSGFATGIGTSFALACDMVLLGEQAFLQVPFARIGLVPDGGMCWHLATRLGPRHAFELAMTGERIAATRCVELGLANRAVPDDRLLAEACAVAEKLAECAPLAAAGTKRLLLRAIDLGLEGTMREEAVEQRRCLGSGDFREGVRAFMAKRAPRFSGK